MLQVSDTNAACGFFILFHLLILKSEKQSNFIFE